MSERRIALTSKAIEIHFPYDEGLVNLVRTLPDRKFSDKMPKRWIVPRSSLHAADVIRVLEPVGFPIPIELRLLAHQATQIKKANKKVSRRKIEGLRQYQVAAVDFATHVGGRVVIGDDMGLGKTVEALATIEDQGWKRGLVIAPANVIYKWQKECERWIPDYSSSVVPKTKGEMPKTDILIMSYNVMVARQLELRQMKWDFLILDEFHHIKGAKTQRTRCAKLLAVSIPHILLLSGRPLVNRPIELFNGLNMLDPMTWGNAYSYGSRYCGGLYDPRGAFKGATNQEELADRLKTIMIRRTKGEVLSELPPLTRTHIPVDIDLREYGMVKQQVMEAIKKLNPDHKGYYVNVLDKLSMLRQAVGWLKIPAATEWAEEFLEAGDGKLVIYCHHHKVVDELSRRLREFRVSTITGATPAQERERRVSAFQNPGGPRIMVITSAGGEGIDLFGLGGVDASRILFVEREWGPVPEEQAEARLHRIGQSNAVEAYYLVARGTVDDDLSKLIEQKRETLKKIVGLDEVKTTVAKELVGLMRGDWGG